VAAQVKSLEGCEKDAPSYPCEGKLPIEAYLMMAVLQEEAGDSDGKKHWLAKAIQECRKATDASSCEQAASEQALARLSTARRATRAIQ